jgi:hypothetical protein
VLRRVLNVACQQGWILKNPFHCGDPLIIVAAERRRERVLTVYEERRLVSPRPIATRLASMTSMPRRSSTHAG